MAKKISKEKKKHYFTKSVIQKVLKCNPKDCILYFLHQDGSLVDSKKKHLNKYLQLVNLLNNIYSYAYIPFPLLYGRNEEDILNKICVLNQCAQERVIFYIENFGTGSKKIYKLEDMYTPGNMLHLVFLKHSNMDSFVKVQFLNEYAKGKIKNFKIDQKNIEELLSFYYFSYTLRFYDPPTDEILAVQLFYSEYIFMIRDEINETYNIDIRNADLIGNYQKLYLLLDKLGYVSRFYKKIYPVVKKRAAKVEAKITSHPQYIELLKYYNSYKPFEDKVLFDIQDINIERLIKSWIQPPLDKAYILREYKVIQENRNFGIRM